MRLVVILALLLCGCGPEAIPKPAWWGGRIVRSPNTNVGIRPAVSCGMVNCDGYAITLQVRHDLFPPYIDYDRKVFDVDPNRPHWTLGGSGHPIGVLDDHDR